MIIPGGEWCDLTTLPDGRPVLVYSSPLVLEALVLGEHEPRWSVALQPYAPPWHYTRADADGRGVICTVAQGHDRADGRKGEAMIFIENRPIPDMEALGQLHGAFCCEVVGLHEGWDVFLLRPGYFERITLSGAGRPLAAHRVATDTSQGFLNAEHGQILQDYGRVYPSGGPPLLNLPESPWGPLADILWVGQHPADPPRIRAVRKLPSGRHETAVLREHGGWGLPHVVRAGDGSIAVCSIAPGGTWFEHYASVDAMPWGNEVVVPPPPPPPDPDPEEPPVPSAPNRFAVVQRVHDANPGLIHRPLEFTNAVAWELHKEDERWGHNIKRGNQGLSVDALAFKEPTSAAGGVCIVDIILGAGDGNEKPAWTDKTQETIDGGTVGGWSMPTKPANGGTGTDPDPGEPGGDDSQVVPLLQSILASHTLMLAAMQRSLEGQATLHLRLLEHTHELQRINEALRDPQTSDLAPIVAAIQELQRRVTDKMAERLPRRVF